MLSGRLQHCAATAILAASWCLASPTQAPTAKHPAPAISAQGDRHVFFRIQSAGTNPAPLSGRLLIFVKKGTLAITRDEEVSTDEFHPENTSVSATEITDLTPGATIEIDADSLAYPAAFDTLPVGDYEAQAVLDTDHSYAYSERTPADWISPVTALPSWTPGSGTEPLLTLDHHPSLSSRRAQAMQKALAQVAPDVAQKEIFASPSLTAFWGHPVNLQSWVILPPGYNAQSSTTYPTAYWTHGFGGTLDYALSEGLSIRKRMQDGKMPPMIWVMLDESCPQGTHEFADSVNNGPWGTALTTEYLPYLEKKYHMDAKPSSRLLNGHSSGGWATLQLQVNYPDIFGGTWSTSPDPSDFHDFTGSDLYAPRANVYRKPDGSPTPIMRDKGKVLATFEQFAKLEEVLGPYGGQVSSFDWVFSPRSSSGAPVPMFDRKSGNVNPEVVAYWHDHYDLAHLVQTRWTKDGAALKGRIHLYVGSADTFYLDGAAHKFEAVLRQLDAEPHFTYIPDRTHFDLYRVSDDQIGLFDQIGNEMYAIARPGNTWKH